MLLNPDIPQNTDFLQITASLIQEKLTCIILHSVYSDGVLLSQWPISVTAPAVNVSAFLEFTLQHTRRHQMVLGGKGSMEKFIRLIYNFMYGER